MPQQARPRRSSPARARSPAPRRCAARSCARVASGPVPPCPPLHRARAPSCLLVLHPLLDESVGVEPGEVAPQLAHELRRLLGRKVPEQDHLAVVDRHDLDPIEPARIGQKRWFEPLARDDQLKRAVGPHAAPRIDRAASSGLRSLSNTRPPNSIAGNERTPASTARWVACVNASAVDRSASPFSSAAGCISQAAPAIRRVSCAPRSRPAANAWRNAASENATPRPVRLA